MMAPRAAAAALVAALFCLLAGPPPAPAMQSETELSLDEAIRLALAGNDRLAASAAEVGAADAGAAEAHAALMPRVEVHETFQRTTNPVFVFGNLLSQEAFGPQNFAIESLNEPDALSNFNTRVAVAAPIWWGGGIRDRIRAAEHRHDAAGRTHERTRQEVIERVIEAWTGAIVARRHVEVARQALETARAHVDLAESLRRGGMVVESDVLMARVRASEVEETVVRADSAVAIADAALNLVLGRDLDTPISLPSLLEGDDLPEADLQALIDRALERRPDLDAVDQQRRAARAMTDAARSELLPSIGVGGLWETNAERFVGTEGTNWSVMVTASLTLFDGGARGARIRRAEQQGLRVERMRDALAGRVALEVLQAWHELRATARRLELTRDTVELARESLRIVEDRYREGLTTLVELLDAQTALTRARTREIAARGDLRVGRARLDLAVGNLRHGST